MTEYVILNLPKFDTLNISFDARYKNWRKFSEYGFCQETRYSYVCHVNDKYDEDILKSISASKRRDVRACQKNFTVDEQNNITDYLHFLDDSYTHRNRELSYSLQRLEKLLFAVQEQHKLIQLFAKDNYGNIRAETCCFQDQRRLYWMFGSFSPEMQISPHAMLTYEAIIKSCQMGLDFDFEGSMIPEVAQYNRGFNPELEPYFVISKYSPRMKFYINIRENMSIIKKLFLHR